MKYQNKELAAELKRVGLNHYANLEQGEATALALNDFLESPDIFNPQATPDVACKQFATDFFRLAAKYYPDLISDQAVKDMCRIFANCIPNGSTQMNILIILGLLKRKDGLALINQVISNNSLILDVANEAKKVIQGEIEIGQGNCRGRWIYI
jgi:hypothetical protein